MWQVGGLWGEGWATEDTSGVERGGCAVLCGAVWGDGRALGERWGLVVWCGGTGDERAWLRGAGRAVAVKENGVRALRAAVAAAVATWACSRASTRGRQRSMCVGEEFSRDGRGV